MFNPILNFYDALIDLDERRRAAHDGPLSDWDWEKFSFMYSEVKELQV